MRPRTLNLRRHRARSTTNGVVAIRAAVLGAWTGRDVAEREKHFAELDLLGVARPSRVPMYFRVSLDRITEEDRIEVIGRETSGEVEFVAFFLNDGIWIGLGSDHTDRTVEAYSVAVSKQLCPKPLAADVWHFDDVADHWDRLVLRAHVVTGGQRRVYQEGNVGTLLSPIELAATLYGDVNKVPTGTILFGGTIPVIGEITGAERFEMELIDPATNRLISREYDIEELPAEE